MKKRYYVRFDWTQVLEHWVLMIAFTALALTGLPQRYSDTAWAKAIADLFGGVGMLREVHHLFAIVLVLLCIFHAVSVGYRIFVLRTPLYILPRWKDLRDLIRTISYNIGLAKSRPQFDRYSFVEKLEYWAVIWGTAIMVLTGFILWNPIWFTSFLPGEFVPAAKAAHGYEAILAVLAILTWHLYHVHIKHFNKSIFTGKMSEEELAHEHPLELERIKRGEVPTPEPQAVRRRRWIFLPAATVFALLMLFGVFYMVTVEQTSIETVMLPDRAPEIPHSLELRSDCLACHSLQAFQPFPASHIGRGNESCLGCHRR